MRAKFLLLTFSFRFPLCWDTLVWLFKNYQIFYRPSNGMFGAKLIIKDAQSFKLDFLCSSRQTTSSVFVLNIRFSLLPFFLYNEMIKPIFNLF